MKELTDVLLTDALYELGCDEYGDEDEFSFLEKILKSSALGLVVKLEQMSGRTLNPNFLDEAKKWDDVINIFNKYHDREDLEDDYIDDGPRKIIGRT